VITGTERVMKRCGLSAWFLDVRRVKRGYYEAEFVEIEDNSRQLPDFELTHRYFRLLEKMILRNPEFYLWTHKRFKYATRLDA
jgi:KDO2-lipid IV(A) lauroyltransferase